MNYYIPVTLLVVIITLVTGLVIRWFRKKTAYWKEVGVPHEEATLNVLTIIRKFISVPIHEVFLEQHRKYGRIYGSYEFANPILTVSEPNLLRDILVKDFHVFNFRREFETGDKIMNKMVTILKGEDWKRVRTIITPAFTSKKMRQMSHIINDCSKTVLETCRKLAEKGEIFDCKAIFGAFTVDVIARSAFATKIDSHEDPGNIFVKHAKQAFAEPGLWGAVQLVLTFFLLPAWITKRLKLTPFPRPDFFRDVIVQVVKERRETGTRYNDILQLLMDAQDGVENDSVKGITNLDTQGDEVDQYGSVSEGITPKLKYRKLYEEELIAQCILFLIVGYETTAATLSFLAYNLALHPEKQEKLITEVDEIFKNHDELNYDIIRDMKYLDCVVSETLRMFPALTRSERTATEDYKLGNTGIVIKKGTVVGFNIHAMHHDPEFFPDPESFCPERFMSENAKHPQYSYLPFGAGPRNCLGMRFALMEIKLCITNVLRFYRFKKAEITKVPLDFKKSMGFLSVDKLPLLVERRNM